MEGEAMKFTFIAHDGNLTPATDEAEAWLRKIKPGDIIEIDVVRPRSQDRKDEKNERT